MILRVLTNLSPSAAFKQAYLRAERVPMGNGLTTVRRRGTPAQPSERVGDADGWGGADHRARPFEVSACAETDPLDQVMRLFHRRRSEPQGPPGLAERRHGGAAETATVLAGAHARASALRGAMRESADADQLAVTLFVARALSGLWVGRRWRPGDVGELLADAARIAAMPVDSFSLAVSLYALCDPALLELSPQDAIETQLNLLLALGRFANVSLWFRDDGRVRCHFDAGDSARTRRACEVAKAALDDEYGEPVRGRLLFGVAVMRWKRPHAGLVARVPDGDGDRAVAFLDQAAAMIGPMLERLSLLEHNAARERSLVKASERRLTRLGFDLHDQPLQQVAALASDLRSFGQQLARPEVGGEHREILAGRVQDLEARLAALDESLRALCHSLEPPTLLARPLPDLLRREVDAFAARTEISIELRVEGDLGGLSDSQRITLVRIVQECLSNAGEHSGADHVRVEVRATDAHLEASVEDNGRGFDVDRTLVDAARRGRLGLVGVHERVRLLGGSCEVRSRVGGPTKVSVSLAQWQQLATGASDVEALAS